eukprot:355100-Heterocapsa_arctica.AAC.1
MLWDTAVAGSASIAIGGVRFRDAGEDYSMKNLTKELSTVVIIMLMSAEIDDLIRQDAPEYLREVRGEPPNI